MIADKNIPLGRLIRWNLPHIVILTAWAVGCVAAYEAGEWQWLKLPWLPLSLIGTAVAFYVGFKNNSAYDRLWEARKVWGAVVNTSRSWGIAIRGYVSNQFREINVDDSELADVHKRLLYRHIGWLYALRSQLLVVKQWEHASQKGTIRPSRPLLPGEVWRWSDRRRNLQRGTPSLPAS